MISNPHDDKAAKHRQWVKELGRKSLPCIFTGARSLPNHKGHNRDTIGCDAIKLACPTDLNNTGSCIQYILPIKFEAKIRHLRTPGPVFFAGVVICFYLVFSSLVLGLALSAILVLQIRHLRSVIDVIYGDFTGCVIQYYSDQWRARIFTVFAGLA